MVRRTGERIQIAEVVDHDGRVREIAHQFAQGRQPGIAVPAEEVHINGDPEVHRCAPHTAGGLAGQPGQIAATLGLHEAHATDAPLAGPPAQLGRRPRVARIDGADRDQSRRPGRRGIADIAVVEAEDGATLHEDCARDALGVHLAQ